jgi:hypothetical protein
MRSTFSGITLGCPSKHSPGGARLQIHHDKRCIRAACRINNEDPIVPAIDRKIIDEGVLGGDRGGQIDDAVQLVGLRIPAYKFRRDTAAHPIVEHPDDSIDVGADAQNRIQGQIGMALPIVQLLVRKRSRRTIALALYDRVIGLVELVLAHYDSAASGDCHVSWSLRQSREDS